MSTVLTFFLDRQALEAVGKHHHRDGDRDGNGDSASSSSKDLEGDLQSLREQLVRLGKAGSGLAALRHPMEPVLTEEKEEEEEEEEEEEAKVPRDEDEDVDVDGEDGEPMPLLKTSVQASALPRDQRQHVREMLQVTGGGGYYLELLRGKLVRVNQCFCCYWNYLCEMVARVEFTMQEVITLQWSGVGEEEEEEEEEEEGGRRT